MTNVAIYRMENQFVYFLFFFYFFFIFFLSKKFTMDVKITKFFFVEKKSFLRLQCLLGPDFFPFFIYSTWP